MRLGKLNCHIFPCKLLIILILAGVPNAAKRIVHAPLDPKVNHRRGYRSAGQMRIEGNGTY